MSLSFVKHDKTFGTGFSALSIIRKIRANLRHTDCKSVCRDELVLHIGRRITFPRSAQLLHYLLPGGLEEWRIVELLALELKQVNLKQVDILDRAD